jgi:hypothetical protein
MKQIIEKITEEILALELELAGVNENDNKKIYWMKIAIANLRTARTKVEKSWNIQSNIN